MQRGCSVVCLDSGAVISLGLQAGNGGFELGNPLLELFVGWL
jgi:hypothetical protein